MAKKVYIGVSSKARQVKKIYIGVSSKARKVKKGYVGVGGVARPFWTTELAYYGTTTSLDEATRENAATTVGNYAIFAGGYSYKTTAVAYSNNLVKSTITALSEGRRSIAATCVGNYAVFAGGQAHSSPSATAKIDYYSADLVRTSGSLQGSSERNCMAATTLDNYALFGGGYDSDDNRCKEVFVIDSDLARVTTTSIGDKRCNMGAATVGNYAIFAGGGSYSNAYAFDKDLAMTTISSLSNTGSPVGTPVGNYALFGGGTYSSAAVDVFDSTLTKTTPIELSIARNSLPATTVGDTAIFAGGNNGSEYVAIVDAFGSDLIRTTPDPLSVARGWNRQSATSVGNYALIGGGYGSKVSDVVDVYMI